MTDLYRCLSCRTASNIRATGDERIDSVCSECEEVTEWKLIAERDKKPRSKSILDDAKEITQDRENVHGTIVETHQAIADLMEVFMRHKYGAEIDVSPGDAADFLDMCLKDARKLTGETNRDTYVDAAGYNHCGWVCREWEEEQ